MQSNIEDFKTGWYGISLGLKSDEIDQLIIALQKLKNERSHFHLRSDFEGSGGIGDIELYYQTDEQPSNLAIESSSAIFANEKPI